MIRRRFPTPQYDRVFLLDVFDGLLPSVSRDDVKTLEDAKLYEEERRLFYVAMTRAKNGLCLFSCDRESSFVKEVREFLSGGADALGISFPALCGQTCTDKDGGTFRITAQCGDRVLAERGDSSSQLLTLEELSREWGVVVRAGNANAKKEASPRSAASRKRTEPLLTVNELFCGMSVAHKSFGGGRIVSFDRQFLEVFFPEMRETKRFALDFTLKNRLLKAL